MTSSIRMITRLVQLNFSYKQQQQHGSGGRRTDETSTICSVDKMGKRNKTALGSSLIRNKNTGKGFSSTAKHTTDVYDSGKPDLKSITDETALNEFIATAELANREFTAEKINTTTIVTAAHIPGILTDEELEEIKKYQQSNKQFLNIPRRPFWDAKTTPEQLEHDERESFLLWRRQLALLGEKDDKIILTPYEKNIDVWRQLWRVIERSDVICQIVDGRNPLLFKCDDLECYVKEVNKTKENIILINKADYLTEKQRKYWAEYFETRNIKVVFWSALMASTQIKDNTEESDSELSQATKGLSFDNETIKTTDSQSEAMNLKQLDTKLAERKDDKGSAECEESMQEKKVEGHSDDDGDDNDDDGDDDDDDDDGDVEARPGEMHKNRVDTKDGGEEIDAFEHHISLTENNDDVRIAAEQSADVMEEEKKYTILTRDELLKYFETFRKQSSDGKDRTVIGMVGFPNVGKSSTINALIGDKKTSVSATPGKTKHFQTINITNSICLCDCPGLVFPTFVSTRAAMILNGVLPVDQLRDYRPPAALLCKCIPRRVLEKTYGINIVRPGEAEDPKRPPTADEFLSAYSSMRGFMTSHGLPDCSRGARHVIKDFLKGKLLYREPPPNITTKEFESVQETSIEFDKKKKYFHRQNSGIPLSNIDKEFFNEPRNSIHYNAPTGMRGQKSPDDSKDEVAGKPWKKHFNRGKKEKVRRIMR